MDVNCQSLSAHRRVFSRAVFYLRFAGLTCKSALAKIFIRSFYAPVAQLDRATAFKLKEPVRGISNLHSGECYIGEYLREMKISYDNTEGIF